MSETKLHQSRMAELEAELGRIKGLHADVDRSHGAALSELEPKRNRHRTLQVRLSYGIAGFASNRLNSDDHGDLFEQVGRVNYLSLGHVSSSSCYSLILLRCAAVGEVLAYPGGAGNTPAAARGLHHDHCSNELLSILCRRRSSRTFRRSWRTTSGGA